MATDQSKRRPISQNWSVTLTVVVKKKKTSTLTLFLMKQLTWPLINFLFFFWLICDVQNLVKSDQFFSLTNNFYSIKIISAFIFTDKVIYTLKKTFFAAASFKGLRVVSIWTEWNYLKCTFVCTSLLTFYREEMTW